jgi:hypothetical protein
MDLTRAVQYLQQAHKDLFDPQPEFSHIFTPSMIYSPGREPRYVPIYPDDYHKWTFPFSLPERAHRGMDKARVMSAKYSGRVAETKDDQMVQCDRRSCDEVTFSETWQITVEVCYIWLLHGRVWTRDEISEIMDRETRGRVTKLPHTRILLRYHKAFSAIRDRTKWILHQCTFVPLDGHYYSKRVFRFVKWLIHSQIQRTSNTAFLFCTGRHVRGSSQSSSRVCFWVF